MIRSLAAACFALLITASTGFAQVTLPSGYVLGSESAGPHPPRMVVSTQPLGYTSGDLSMAAWVRFDSRRVHPQGLLFGVQNPGTDFLAEGIRFSFDGPISLAVGDARVPFVEAEWHRVVYVREGGSARIITALPPGDPTQPLIDPDAGDYLEYDGRKVSIDENRLSGPQSAPFSVEVIARTARAACSGYMFGKPLTEAEAASVGRQQYHGGAKAFSIGMDGCADGVTRLLHVEVLGESGQLSIVGSGVEMPLEAWVRVVAVVDGSAVTLYQDGVLVGDGPGLSGALYPTESPATVGGLVAEGVPAEGIEFWNWDGAIALVRVYDHALTAEEAAGRTGIGCADGELPLPAECWDLGPVDPSSWLVTVDSSSVAVDDTRMGLATFGGIQHLGADYSPGVWVSGAGMPTDTYLSDLMAYDGVWTQADVDSLLTGGVFPVTNRWPADEGAGNRVGDVAGSNPLQLGQWGGFDADETFGGNNRPLIWRHMAAADDSTFSLRSGVAYVNKPEDTSPGYYLIHAGDLDRDGDIDLIRPGINWSDCGNPIPGAGLLTLSREGGGYEASWHSYGSLPTFMVAGEGLELLDLDGDRQPEVVAGDGGIDDWCGRPAGLNVYRNNSTIDELEFSAEPNWSVPDPFYFHQSTTGDLNRDGRIDVVSAGSGTAIYFNTVSGFEDATDELLPEAYRQIEPGEPPLLQGGLVEVLDVDKDGFLDLLITHDGSGHAPPEEQILDSVVLYNPEAGAFERSIDAARWHHGYDPAYNDSPLRPRGDALDIDADGDQDLVLINSGGWYERNGTFGAFLRVMENKDGVLTENENWGLTINPAGIYHWGDVNGDGYLDLVVWSDPENAVLLFDPSIGWMDATPYLPLHAFSYLALLENQDNGPTTIHYQHVCGGDQPQPCPVSWWEMTATERLIEFFPTTPVPIPAPPSGFVLDTAGLHWTVAETVTCADLQFARDQAFEDIFLEHLCYANDTLSVHLPTEAYYFRAKSHRAARVSTWSATFAAQGAVSAAPIAVDDAFELLEDTPLPVDVANGLLTNDAAPSGYVLTAVLVDSTAHGALELSPDGSFTFTPNSDFFGEDAFSYFATDGYDSTGVAQVTLTVVPVNDAPVPAAISDPPPGGALTVGGDPAGVLRIEWPAAVDVEGDPLIYAYHLSTTEAYTDTVWTELTGATSASLGVGELASRLTAVGIGEGGSRTFFHRVYASDPDTTSAGPSAELTLVRGAVTGIIDMGELPTEVTLLPAYPNPFNPETTLSFGLPAAAEVRFELFDMLGRRVRVLADGTRSAGWHRLVLEAGGLATGSYVMRLEAGETTRAGAVVLLR